MNLPQVEMFQKLDFIKGEMMKEEPIDIPAKHYFSEGVYAREITIPKDTVVLGKIHKFSQLNILSKGEISVLTETGVKRVQAPFTIVSPPGTQRIAYTHEECVWTTVHGTDLTDLDEIENHFIAKDYQEYLAFCGEKKCLGSR